jgi:small-conductance mechanosensitive channel
VTSDQIAAHVGETADWFRHLSSAQPASVDPSTKDRVHQQLLTAVQLALEFGKASAKLLNEPLQLPQTAGPNAPATGPNSAPNGAKGFAGRLDQAAANIDQHIMALQSQLDALDQQIQHARKKERETLLAQKAQVNAALQLAREVQGSVQDMEDFETSSIAGDSKNLSPLSGKLADIERSIPELRETSQRDRTGTSSGRRSADSVSGSRSGGRRPSGDGSGSAGSSSGGAPEASASNTARSATNNAPTSNALRLHSAGVIALVGEWFSLNDSKRPLSAAIQETGDLQDEIEKLRSLLVDQVRNVVGKDLAISTSTDPAELLAQRAAVQQDTSRFKQLASVLVPLGEQALVVESVRNTLDEFRATLNTRMTTVARYLVVRIAVVLGWIAAVLVISDIWRRATFRYLHDQRRRRQFLVLRRAAVALALTFVIIFGLISEVGSLATYIGFLTAGIAVALQNVILAVVAYFFFIGRYGVRVGDRITLAGVTGRVVEIGLVRIYLMELAGPDLHATGRMVVLSNAVLFQPTAMFKQIPGADYVWHTVTLTIAATADVQEAHKRLRAASDEVYEKYRESIERQHAMMQRFIDFDASSPRPEIRVRLTENGLECSVRYPVMLDNAAVIDQQMLKALRDALEQDSQFKLVATGAVVLRSSDT